MSGLIESLAHLNKKKEIDLAFDFYGLEADHQTLTELGTACDYDAMNLNAGIKNSEFSQKCSEAKILILSVGHGRKHEETIPRKLYGYYRAQRPIIVLGPAGCEAGKMVESHLDAITKCIKQVVPLENLFGKTKGYEKLHAVQKRIRIQLEVLRKQFAKEFESFSLQLSLSQPAPAAAQDTKPYCKTLLQASWAGQTVAFFPHQMALQSFPCAN